MAQFSFMMTIPAYFKEAQVREVLESLGLGVIEKIDTAPAQKADYVKYFVHYSTATATGTELAKQLADVARRQSDGEVNVYPKRIEHGVRRDGSTMYWQIFKTATPAERVAKTAAQAEKASAEKVAPRLV
jgi:hypothetical protein